MTISGWVASVPASIVRDKVKPGKYKGGVPSMGDWAMSQSSRWDRGVDNPRLRPKLSRALGLSPQGRLTRSSLQ